jgi:hypothetical protein
VNRCSRIQGGVGHRILIENRGKQDFISQRGISSALRRENAKSEMSHRARQIHRDLVIADQWTEPHSPWQNPAELNGVKYLYS